MRTCALCDRQILAEFTGEPYLEYNKPICYQCYIAVIPLIYKMAGVGDGGIIHLLFKECLYSSHNRAHRKTIPRYRAVLEKLLHKYKFRCVHCGEGKKDLLTIDHIHPVSKGGAHEESNLQILCRSCNSSKGAR